VSATSHAHGHPIIWSGSQWVYADNKESIDQSRPCVSCGTYEHQVAVDIEGKRIGVDACIAPIVAALNRAGIRTVASCCGHGGREGEIALADGRWLTVTNGPLYAEEVRSE
jgi:hypothetical protein